MMKINYKALVIILLSAISSIFSELNPDNVIVAINCGGDSYKDSHGIQYEKVSHHYMI